MSDIAERFSRVELLLGADAQRMLSEAHVLVVGLGAVGGYCVEALARAGVGRISLVDFDIYKPSNVNRQLHSLTSTIGRKKTEIVLSRILEINPSCEVKAHELFVDDSSVGAMVDLRPTVTIDAIDSLNSKVCLLAAFQEAKLPIFSSMGAALRRDPTAIRMGLLGNVVNCSLARLVRKRLRRRGVELDIPCVYSTEKVQGGFLSPQDSRSESAYLERGRERNTLGSLPTLTSIFGIMLAHHVIEKLQISDSGQRLEV